MPSTNTLQIASVEEVTLGTTPTTPRMRLRRVTGESLNYTPIYLDPGELRSDRMTSDELNVGTQSTGGINYPLIYPAASSPNDSDIKSAMYNTWTNAPTRDNDGDDDSDIADVATAGEVVTVLTGDAFAVGHLVNFTGFGVANNNGVFRATTASATVPAFVGSGITDEAAPAAAAKMEVVGFAGEAGDITAAAAGLASTVLDFTTLGLTVGQSLKIGGTAAGDRFTGTAADNAWVRISGAITATAIPLDNLPSGWAIDAGAGKTIKVWFGDHIINGSTQLGQTLERGFLGQTVPTYIAQAGLVASQYQLNYVAHQDIKVAVTYLGMGGTQGTVALDAAPDAVLTNADYPVFASSANVGRVGEAGATLTGPNFVREFMVTINNNDTPIDDITTLGPAGITGHESTVTGTLTPYFGDNSLLTKFFAGTATSISIRATKGSQAFIVQIPRAIYNGGGSPNSSGKNQDQMLPLNFKASKDEALTNAQICFDRLSYFEA